MAYLVLLHFNSMQNAAVFARNPNYVPLSPETVSVPSGYTPPAQGIGSPGSSPVNAPNWVIISVTSMGQVPQGYTPMWVFDTTTKTTTFSDPSINPADLTIKGGPTGDQYIINHGVPNSNAIDDLTPPPPTNLPFEFDPLYPQPLSQQPLIEVMPPGEIPEINYNPYLLTPQPLSDVPPPDYVPLNMPPPGITDPRVIPVSDFPMNPDVLRDPNLVPPSQYYWPLPEYPPISKDPYNPNRYYPENPANPDFYDPINPNVPQLNPEPPVPGEVPLEVVPSPDSPDPYKVPIPNPNAQRPQPTLDDGGGSPGGSSLPSIWGCTGGNQPLIVIQDDSCTIYTSSDGGNNFCSAGTPVPTNQDDWIDGSIPVNDSASPTPNVFAMWNLTVARSYDPTQFAGGVNGGGGVQVISPKIGSAAVAPIRNYSPGIVGVNFQQCISGAISSNGIILTCPMFSDQATWRPRISTDFGVTWSDVSGLPLAAGWSRACFSKNATTMYIAQYLGSIYKSTNSGSTWTQIVASGSPSSFGGNGEAFGKVRCSQDGSVFAGIAGEDGIFYITKDGGTTWNSTNFKVSFGVGPIAAIDFGMPIDGSKFLVMITSSSGLVVHAFTSSNGTSWTNITSSIHDQGHGAQACSYTPDGTTAIIVYGVAVTTVGFDLSTDGGVTWTLKSFVFNPVTHGLVASAFVLPAGSWV